MEIGRWKFPTKRAAKDHIHEILSRYENGADLVNEDKEFVWAILRMLPHFRIIEDCGIASIFVQHIDTFSGPARRFCVYRRDGSKKDFSWRGIICPEKKHTKLAGVLRGLVVPYIRAFKDEHFRGICETCGARIRKCVVDHAQPHTFERIMYGWLQSNLLEAEDIDIIKQPGYECSSELPELWMNDNWIEYHEIQSRGHLRCVCRRCNSSTLRA
jgi:hypothetical protein